MRNLILSRHKKIRSAYLAAWKLSVQASACLHVQDYAQPSHVPIWQYADSVFKAVKWVKKAVKWAFKAVKMGNCKA